MLRVASLSLVLLCLASKVLAQVDVPPELQPWRGWVLQDQKHLSCPFLSTAEATNPQSYRCAWPERLAITVESQGGSFTQSWQVYNESWVEVPGDTEHWPRELLVDGKAGALVAREGVPMLRLAPGNHSVSGRWTWLARPESLRISTQTVLLDLTIDGKRIALPERPDGAVWLGKRRTAEEPQRMDLQVYRLVQDEIPARLITLIRVQASGDGREELFSRVLPEGFVPVSLQSALPVRLEPDGRLRVQVRAGSWEISLDARGAGVATQLARPAVSGPWSKEEIWSFAGDDRLRVAAAQGAEGIDPAQANVPQDWRGYPAFRMGDGASLTIAERSRGLENVDDNRLTLWRQLWLDFDHGGFTAIDEIQGTMRRDWRLDMVAPYRLENARSGGDTLLVTQSPGSKQAGIELRTQNLSLKTVARSAGSRGVLPATGWDTRFENVRGELNLPPGHRLLAALGADSAPQSWLEQWELWDVFGVLIITVLAAWVAGWPVGIITLGALLLTYQESPAYIWLWGNLLAAVALARVAPEGKLKVRASLYRTLSFIVLAIALLPLLWGQLRLAVYPQLEASNPYESDISAVTVARNTAPAAPAPPPLHTEIAQESASDAAMEAPESSRLNLSRARSKSAAGAGLNYEQLVQRYAPGTLLQSGPGIPSWRFRVYSYLWSGPVEADQTVRFIYIGPVLVGLWRIAGVTLLAVLLAALWNSSSNGTQRWQQLIRWNRPMAAGAASVLFMVLLIVHTSSASAAPTPDAELLTQLKQRLTQPPPCAPTCGDIMSAKVAVAGDRLNVSLDVSALANVAVAMPGANDRWQIDSATIDGRSSLAMGREGDGALWVPVTVGVHRVVLSGSLAAAQSVQLNFPMRPHHVAAAGEGWDITGINEDRLLSGSLELTRRRAQTAEINTLEGASEFPPFVRVRRQFDLGLDWNLTTLVERVAPERAALNIEVPLVNGESVLSNEVRTRDAAGGQRYALVGLEREQARTGWLSGLPRGSVLELELPESAARTEVWSFVISPQWNVEFAGLPAVLPESLQNDTWVFEFHPRPGEKLKLNITRPLAASGATLAIDSVNQRVEYGKRSSTTTLQFSYRTTQGGRHVVKLPDTARVTSLQIDGNASSLRPDHGELPLSLVPGEHQVTVIWTDSQGAGMRSRAPAVDLHSPASNVTTTLRLPFDRWVLFATGPGFGPAIIYWAELLVFIVTAVLLGRWPQSPLRTHEWLLLGFGLSTLSWSILTLVAVWLFAMRWRNQWNGAVSRFRYNFVQATLAALTLIAVGTLVFAGIRQSLLAAPDMGVAGFSSYGTSLSWFLDRTQSALPQPLVISLPIWAYRAAMFAWALWIASALIRWLRFAWQAWRTHGIWKARDDGGSAIEAT
jgi:hypothetical protein